MSQVNLDAVRRAYESFRRRDLEALFELFDAEIEIYQSYEIPWGGRYKGHDQARQFYDRLTHAVDSRVEIERTIDSADHVVTLGRTHGTARATGRPFDVPFVHVWALRSGRVVRFESYVDIPAIQEALGR
jgi:ketosteroid isomerase-like protein